MATKAVPRKKKQPRHAPWWHAWWPVLAIVALAVAAGIAYQGFRTTTPPPAVSGTPTFVQPDGSVLRGNPSAPVLIEEYGDFQCPVCKRWEDAGGPTVQSLVDSGQARFAYHPIAILGQESVAASNAALCTGDADKFWAYHDLLYRNQGAENSGYLTTNRLTGWGAQVGAGDGFAQCVSEGRYRNWVASITDKASQQGINATPTIFVNGKRLTSLDPALLRQMVQQAAG